MRQRHQKLATVLLLTCGALFLGGCSDKTPQEQTPQEKAPTVSDSASQEITNYIQEPQQKVRDANKAILDADQARRKALDEN